MNRFLTDDQLDYIIERTARERREQGLPPTVTDPVVLAKVARIVAGARNAGSVPVSAGPASGAADGAGSATSEAGAA